MRAVLSERNLVVVLFVMVIVTFSLAHEDTKKMEQAYHGATAAAFALPGKGLTDNRQLPATDKKTVAPAASRQPF